MADDKVVFPPLAGRKVPGRRGTTEVPVLSARGGRHVASHPAEENPA